MWSAEELIVAPATVPGRGARAIVRLAGAGLADLLPQLFTPRDPGWPGPAARPRAVRAVLAHDGLGREWGGLDVEILCWPGPGGPIGGPLAEVQLPACCPLVDAVVAEACRLGARLARGGEFTLRAFLSGRLDLVQAEAVLGVVDARSPEQLAAALDRFGGGAGRALAAARNDLLDLLADLEASIDFADESAPDGVPVATDWSHVAARLEGCRRSVAAVMARHADRDGAAADVPRVALVGRPNIGKSSLFNALVGRAAALVADEAGTTRDWVEARIFGVRGRDWLLVDLAGQDDATAIPDDPLAAVAMARCRAEAERADIVVACRDAGDRRPAADVSGSRPRIEVLTRCDRLPSWPAHADPLATSAATGAGVAAARDAIDAAVAILPAATSATVRMRAAAGVAIAAIAEAGRLVTASVDRHPGAEAADEAVVAGSIRAAVEALAEATGIGFDGELLDRIFSRHCIGK